MATALITGASGGIGLELAHVFARHGHDLVLVARSVDKLEALAAELTPQHKVKAVVIGSDLSDPEAPARLFEETQRRGIAVDVLVNNAGYTVFGPFAETDLKAELDMIGLNIAALTHLTKLYLGPMRERKQGRILNLASTAAFQPGPLMAVYYASKAYVLFFSEALAVELEGSGVTVTALCPGATRTGFQARGHMERSKLVAGREIMDAKTVAEAGYAALMLGKAVSIPGTKNAVMAFFTRFVPRWLAPRIAKAVQEPVK